MAVDPADVVLRCVEATTNLPLEDLTLFWSSPRPEGSSGGIVERAEFDPDASGYAFRCGVGRVDLMISESEYKLAERAPLEIRAGRNELVIRVKRLLGIRLTLGSGGKPVRWTDHAVVVKTADGEEVNARRSFSSEQVSITVPEPGRYRVQIPMQDGYAKIEDFDVRVDAGFVDRAIELRARE